MTFIGETVKKCIRMGITIENLHLGRKIVRQIYHGKLLFMALLTHWFNPIELRKAKIVYNTPSAKGLKQNLQP